MNALCTYCEPTSADIRRAGGGDRATWRTCRRHRAAFVAEPSPPSGSGPAAPITFFVAGIPKTLSVGSSVRTGDGRSFQTRRGTPWATLVGYAGRQHAPAQPFAGAVSLTATFYLPRPTSAPKRVTRPLKRPDLDNLFHKLTDAWNGVFWLDDAQIVNVSLTKAFGDRVGLAISITEEGAQP